MDDVGERLRRFFRGYGLLALVISSLVLGSYVYAEVIVGTNVAGQLDNATITVSLTASVPTKYRAQTPTLAYSYSASVPAAQRLSFPVRYSCELVINASGTLSTIPCFTTTTTTTESATATTSTTTTTSNYYSGGGGAPAPIAPITPAPVIQSEEATSVNARTVVIPLVGTFTLTVPKFGWIVTSRGSGSSRLALLLLGLAGLLLLYLSLKGGARGGRRRR